MARALGFSLDLEGVVPGTTYVVDVRDDPEGSVRFHVSATEGIPGNRARSAGAGIWRMDSQIHAVHQNVRAVGTCVPRSQNDIPRHLAFNIQVVLLNHALLEITILREDTSRESIRVWGRHNRLKVGL